MTSMPGIDLGSSASVAGSVSASLRHGIWMMSFTETFAIMAILAVLAISGSTSR